MADGVLVSIVGNSLTRITFLKGEAAKIEEVVNIWNGRSEKYDKGAYSEKVVDGVGAGSDHHGCGGIVYRASFPPDLLSSCKDS